MSIAVENLPNYEQISCKPIRDNAAAFDAAKAAQQERRRDLIELEQTREQAEWRDAAAAEKALAERNPAPKRTYVATHDRRTDDARHQVKVAQLAFERSERDLIGSLERNGAAWATEVEQACSALVEQWTADLADLTALYAKLAQASAVARVVIGGKRARISVIELDQRQLDGIELAQGSVQRAMVQVPDVLAALSSIGHLQPGPEPVRHPPPRKGQGDPRLRGRADVEAEIAERRALEGSFAERTRR